ncbi:MAG: DUF4252 domain-containing protein [Flavobacteriaceae bacterium]|nr:DUF4252 domain-containing protein [Flavobacteriaceae bacterium]
MKQLLKISALLMVMLLTSCADQHSLQKYYVDNQDNADFISIDIPASVITLKDNVSAEDQEALKSLKKMNILAFKKNDTNGAEFLSEENKVKSILKNDKYIELMKFKDKGRNVVVKYEGDDNEIDEVVVFASDKEKGFALVRVLGDNMQPAKIANLAKNIADIDADGLKQFEGLLK